VLLIPVMGSWCLSIDVPLDRELQGSVRAGGLFFNYGDLLALTVYLSTMGIYWRLLLGLIAHPIHPIAVLQFLAIAPSRARTKLLKPKRDGV